MSTTKCPTCGSGTERVTLRGAVWQVGGHKLAVWCGNILFPGTGSVIGDKHLGRTNYVWGLSEEDVRGKLQKRYPGIQEIEKWA